MAKQPTPAALAMVLTPRKKRAPATAKQRARFKASLTTMGQNAAAFDAPRVARARARTGPGARP